MSGFTARDNALMQRALELAAGGLYGSSPNPRVGCVLSRDDEIVGEGFHRRAGGPHAEIEALQQAGAAARGATAYVSLEPCNHQGRTGPCTQALLSAGVTHVVYAMADAGATSGGGAAALRAAGVTVSSGLLATEAAALNPGFHRRQQGGRPWVRLKVAQSLDGHTALPGGESQWITGNEARADVHRWRARSCAVLTGIGTVLADDPQMTARCPESERQALRVVLDSRLRTPPQARIRDDCAPTLLLHAQPGSASTEQALCLPAGNGGLDLTAVLETLAARDCNEIWVEAGPSLIGSFLQSGLWDELLVYIAPCLLGAGRPLAHIPPLAALAERLPLEFAAVDRVGADLRLILRPNLT